MKDRRRSGAGRLAAAAMAIALAVACVPALLGCEAAENESYSEAVALMEDGRHEEAAKAFWLLGDYKDSAEQAAAAKEAINKQDYDAAVAAEAAGDLEGAAELYDEAGDYGDAGAKAEAVRGGLSYEQGAALEASGDYAGAAKSFADAGGYGDAAVRAEAAMRKASYEEAVQLESAGYFDRALDAFLAAGGESDAAERARSLREEVIPYWNASALFDGGDYEAAADAFEALGGYSDSAERAAEAVSQRRYLEAEAASVAGDLKGAYAIYYELSGFSDSDDRRSEIDGALYAEAVDAAAAGELSALDDYAALPGAERVDEAIALMQQLDAQAQEEAAAAAFGEAVEQGTAIALLEFIGEWEGTGHGDGPAEEAAVLVEALLSNSELSRPILSDPNAATTEMIDAFVRDYPGHVDEPKVLALSSGSIVDLAASGTISYVITGETIDYTNVSLKNATQRVIDVTIPFGAYFESESSGVQNMVVRDATAVSLAAMDTTTMRVATACMNIRRSIPGESDGFGAAVLEGGSKLARVVELCDEQGASYAVTQAAVWIVTDNPGDSALLSTLVYSDGTSAIGEDDLAKAKEIVALAG